MKKFIAILLIFAGSLAPLASTAPYVAAQFDPLEETCQEGNAARSPVCQIDAEDPVTGSDGVILDIVNILSIAAGIAAVIIIIVSGIGLITSQGDGNSVKNNRNAIIYAALGIVVIVLSRTIVVFIITRAT